MKGKKIMKKGFTLAEVLITLAIIGVVAALTIPSVILNTNQQEYKTALKKAVSVLNQAVALNLAVNNESPSEATTASAFINSIQGQMNTISTATSFDAITVNDGTAVTGQSATFTTADGMQFILAQANNMTAAGKASVQSVNSGNGTISTVTVDIVSHATACGYITSSTSPCYILVDVNGQKAPNKITTSADAPSDRFVLMFTGPNGTTITPAGEAAKLMFNNK